MTSRLLAAVAMIVCLPHAAGAASATVEEPQSMRFEWVREGPAHVCRDKCRIWVSAAGPITQETVKDFEWLSEVKDLRNATLVLDSGGGSVLASLELGRRVRALGMATTVGRIIKLPTGPGQEQRGRFSPRGECASMCVFVLLGGVKRFVPPEARVLVHQIWPGSKRADASAETYTAEELVRVQRDVGRIAAYTVEMGGDIALFELAMRIPPWERLRSLSQSELRRMGLQTIETADVRTSGAITPRLTEKVTADPGNAHGWIVYSEGARPELLRRHPLTHEGEQIGRFELTLGCGEHGSYRLSYLESRSLNPTEADTRLQDVVVRFAGERTALSIASSKLTEPGELASRATGNVKTRLVEKLLSNPSQSILVTTRTTDNTHTSIRVGVSGFANAYPQFAARCKQQ